MNYERKIIELLIMEKQPLTSKTIAMYLNVSQRSVISYISKINASADKTFIFAVNKGYVAQRQNLFDYLDNMDDDISPDNRQEAITIKLLVSESPINLFEISEELFVSESTILSLISQMNKAYSKMDIRVVRTGDDLIIEGSDNSRRLLLKKMIDRYQGEAIITLDDIYMYFKPSEMVDNVIKSIHKVSDEFSLVIDDFFYISFIIHCCVAIYINYHTSNADEDIELTVYDEVHQRFIELIESSCEIELSTSNIEYIVGQFDFAFYNRNRNTIVNPKFRDIIDEAFEGVKEKFGINLTSERRSNSVDTHILAMVKRTRLNKKIFCPLTETIKKDYMILFEVGIFITSEIEKKFELENKINEHEVALLTIHINSLISEIRNKKISTALIIPERINKREEILEFFSNNFSSELDITAVAAHKDSLYLDNFDLVFSATFGNDIEHIKQLDIFDLKRNINIVGDAIDEYYIDLSVKFIHPRICELFEEDLFLNNIEQIFSDKYDILKFMSNLLLNKGYIDDVAIESIIEREDKASTRFGDVAIPHEFNASAEQTKICVLKSEQGYVWDNGVVHLVLMIVINPIDREHFHHFLNAITKLIGSDHIDLIVSKKFEFDNFINYLSS